MRNTSGLLSEKKPKQEKFNFERMKLAATSEDAQARKQAFIEYFERFSEFPSFLFDNAHEIDNRLLQTIRDLQADPLMTNELKKGIDLLLQRLPAA
ncbi:MAG TPA: hypothetical protein VMU25_03560 [Candidatus Paceibacterota bacterium]|nr:hypothetical protein [Candidatus Paceibacterota bacterium]